MSDRTSRSFFFAVYLPFLLFRKAEPARFRTVRGATLDSLAAFRSETRSDLILPMARLIRANVF